MKKSYIILLSAIPIIFFILMMLIFNGCANIPVIEIKSLHEVKEILI